MRWDEQAKRLRAKAAQDEEAMTILMAAASAPDEVIGFHAQEDIPLDSKEPFNRVQVAECVARTRLWVDQLLG